MTVFEIFWKPRSSSQPLFVFEGLPSDRSDVQRVAEILDHHVIVEIATRRIGRGYAAGAEPRWPAQFLGSSNTPSSYGSQAKGTRQSRSWLALVSCCVDLR